MSRCMYYSSVMGIDLGMFYKRRDYSVIINGKNPIVAHEYLGRDVQDKDVVCVKVLTDGRNTIFGDVVVRVNENFALAMHIDTDESNAAACGRNQMGEIVMKKQ